MLLSVSSARKRSGAERLATLLGRLDRLEQLDRPSPAGPPLQGTELGALDTRGQSRETGSLSRSPGSVGAPAKRV